MNGRAFAEWRGGQCAVKDTPSAMKRASTTAASPVGVGGPQPQRETKLAPRSTRWPFPAVPECRTSFVRHN